MAASISLPLPLDFNFLILHHTLWNAFLESESSLAVEPE